MIQIGKCLAAQVEFYSNSVAFYLADFGMDGKRRIASDASFEEVAEGLLVGPSFRLNVEAAQELFEQLWSQGFRSKHDRGGADKLDAARVEHLIDLRKAAKLA